MGGLDKDGSAMGDETPTGGASPTGDASAAEDDTAPDGTTPGDGAQRPVDTTSDRTIQWQVTPLGGMKRTGRWRPRGRIVLVTLIGGMDLDMREAELSTPEVTVTKVSLIGGVRLRVPPGVRVEVSGFTLLGGRRIELPDEGGPDAPTVRLRAFGLSGGVHVTG
jgi:hypothetical protein